MEFSGTRFEVEQREYQIADVKIGGKVGANPTALIGSIFYDGQKIVKHPSEGEFDIKKAEELIQKAKQSEDATGNPMILDVVADTPRAMTRYIDFVSNQIDGPFLIDSSNSSALIAALKYATEVGLHERIIYNSINWRTTQQEFDALNESKVKACIIFAFNQKNPTIQGRLSLLKGFSGNTGLIDTAKQAGMEKILIDTCALDTPDIGPAVKAALRVKEEYGYPSGCASVYMVDTWVKGRQLEKRILNECVAAGLAYPAAFNTDFIFYGPIEMAPHVHYVSSLFNGFMAYTSRQYGIRQSSRHPINKIFKA
jgi:tetrahydromethanopterin S-methyltransferase subunit H